MTDRADDLAAEGLTCDCPEQRKGKEHCGICPARMRPAVAALIRSVVAECAQASCPACLGTGTDSSGTNWCHDCGGDAADVASAIRKRFGMEGK